jgi:hypothetical protein
MPEQGLGDLAERDEPELLRMLLARAVASVTASEATAMVLPVARLNLAWVLAESAVDGYLHHRRFLRVIRVRALPVPLCANRHFRTRGTCVHAV